MIAADFACNTDLCACYQLAQVETGNPFMLYKDSANRKSNQQNLGTIKSSNLCTGEAPAQMLQARRLLLSGQPHGGMGVPRSENTGLVPSAVRGWASHMFGS